MVSWWEGAIDDIGVEFHIAEILAGVSVLSVAGSVDHWAASGFGDALERGERHGSRGLIVSLDRATYFGAEAFCVLSAAAQRAAGAGANIVVCLSRHIATRVLALLNFKHPLVETLAAALLLVRCSATRSSLGRSDKRRLVGLPIGVAERLLFERDGLREAQSWRAAAARVSVFAGRTSVTAAP